MGAVLIAAALAGCGSTGLLDTTSASDVQAINAGQPAVAAAPAPVSQSRVSLAPVMGAPEAVSKQVGSQLSSSLERQRVGIAQGSDQANYTLRGYMVATREKAGTKVAYIFDLTDTSGKRVNRIQGEETAQGGGGSDPWSAVTPEVSQRITDKTASSLAAMLAAMPGGSGAAMAKAPPVGAGAGSIAPQQVSAVPAAAGPTTGSINSGAAPGSLIALIPAVTGAPGDGNAALANAMRQELQQAGVSSGSPGQKGYTVAGKVSAGPVKDGKQSIKIDWRVSDPAGGLLATVSQNNEIQAGALDGTWGNIASDAAQGAASRIKQLIDDHRAGSGKVARARG